VDHELRDAFERLTSDLRNEIQSGDAELRDALGQLASDLRAEIRSGDAELRDALGQLSVDLRGEIRAGDAETRAHLEAATEHFDVVGEALRGDIRSLAELMAISNERVGSLSSASRSR
jgi:predicted ATPase